MGRTIGIVGAGLAGVVTALFLERRGHSVTLIEKHPDPRPSAPVPGRSINLTLTRRGLDALDALSLGDVVRAAAAPATVRRLHLTDGRTLHQPYGDTGDCLYSISRHRLTALLLEHALRCPRIGAHFETHVGEVGLDDAVLVTTGIEGVLERGFDIVIGADGVHSRVRAAMQRRRGFDFSQRYSEHANVELTVPAGRWPGECDALHVWPREEAMLIAFPNPDRSFTLTLQLPVEGPLSAARLLASGNAGGALTSLFPDIAGAITEPLAALAKNPAVPMISIRFAKWYAGERVCLIGDAAHAVFPSLGQGTNAAFEDAWLLDRCLDDTGEDFGAAFRAFYERRKPATDALCALAEDHYQKLRQGTPSADPAETYWRGELRRLVPAFGHSLYGNIAFTHIPYDRAIAGEKALTAALSELIAARQGFESELPRTLEPEVMDSSEDAVEYDAIDNRAVNALFVDYLVEKLGFREGNVVDLGCGTADIPIALAQRLPHARITAVEMSSHMLAIAHRKIEAAGLSERITLVQGDAKATGLPAGSFDLILCNSLVHHIPRPVELFREVARLRAERAAVFLKDLRRPQSEGDVDALVAQHAANDTLYQRLLFRNSLHAALRPEEVCACAREAGLRDFTLTVPGDRHWQLECWFERRGSDVD